MAPRTRPKRKLRFSQPKKSTASVGGSWAKSTILSPQSAILSEDVRGFLMIAISKWKTDYSDAEKRSIIDTLPTAYRVYQRDEAGSLVCPIEVDFIKCDPYLKRAISKFQEDVSEGSYEEKWQNQARKAMQERAEGKFDDYLQQHVEEMYGDVGVEKADEEAQERDDTGMSSDGSWSGQKGTGGRKTNARGVKTQDVPQDQPRDSTQDRSSEPFEIPEALKETFEWSS